MTNARHIAALIVTAALLGACSQQGENAGDGSSGSGSSTWHTSLESENGSSVQGSATISPGVSANMTQVQLTVTGAPPNTELPWHIHSGSCGSKGQIVGDAKIYPPLFTDNTGAAEIHMALPVTIATPGKTYVNIHKSPSDMGTIVACGEMEQA